MNPLKPITSGTQKLAGQLFLIISEKRDILGIIPEDGFKEKKGKLIFSEKMCATNHPSLIDIICPINSVVINSKKLIEQSESYQLFTGTNRCDKAVKEGKIPYKLYYQLAKFLEEEDKTELLEKIGEAIELKNYIPFYEKDLEKVTRALRGGELTDCLTQEEQQGLEDDQSLFLKLIMEGEQKIAKFES